MNGGIPTVSGKRDLAVKFSPYNLTNTSITESTVYVNTGYQSGNFVKYPTQAGAFFQWTGTTGYERRAYHPTTTTSLGGNWSVNFPNAYWNTLGATHETCPNGFRRPTVGDITTAHTSQPASGSEYMQSLFYETLDNSNQNPNSDNYRYFGYYADGYFDRRPIVNAVGASAANNTAVSANTKDVAYIGILYTNPATNASLFVPAAGFRHFNNGTLTYSGDNGGYWTSSAYNGARIWGMYFRDGLAFQAHHERSYGFTVRCVQE
jgi:hypothetical protein